MYFQQHKDTWEVLQRTNHEKNQQLRLRSASRKSLMLLIVVTSAGLCNALMQMNVCGAQVSSWLLFIQEDVGAVTDKTEPWWFQRWFASGDLAAFNALWRKCYAYRSCCHVSLFFNAFIFLFQRRSILYWTADVMLIIVW